MNNYRLASIASNNRCYFLIYVITTSSIFKSCCVASVAERMKLVLYRGYSLNTIIVIKTYNRLKNKHKDKN